MIFKRRPAPLSAAVRVFALISISSIAFGIDITIDCDEYLVSPIAKTSPVQWAIYFSFLY